MKQCILTFLRVKVALSFRHASVINFIPEKKTLYKNLFISFENDMLNTLEVIKLLKLH